MKNLILQFLLETEIQLLPEVITASTFAAGTFNFTLAESKPDKWHLIRGVALAFTATGATTDADLFADAINAHGFNNIRASVDASNRLVIEHNDGGEMRIKDTSSAFANAGFTAYNYTTKLGTANFIQSAASFI